MSNSKLSERDICTKFITPALVAAGWDIATQIREEVSFTKGRIIVRGKLVTRGVLAGIPRGPSVTVLNSRRRRPWSEPGIESAMQRAKRDALAAAIADGRSASGIEHLRFHDLRGTAVTNFVRAGMSINEIAMMLGWKLGQVDEIARRYVTDEARVLAVAKRLRKTLQERKM